MNKAEKKTTNDESVPTRASVKFKDLIEKHAVFFSIVLALLMGIIAVFFYETIRYPLAFMSVTPEKWPGLVISGLFCGIFIIYPVVLTAAELYLLFRTKGRERLFRRGIIFDIITFSLGILYSFLYLGIAQSVMFSSDWNATLRNAELHTPIFTESWPTLAVIACIGAAGYFIIGFCPLKKLPPLVIVAGMAAMYLSAAESILWGIQICKSPEYLILLLLPFNCIVITAKTVIYKVSEWKKIPRQTYKIDRIPFLRGCNRLLMKSERWSIAALLLMWPIAGVLIALLTLLGQAPDAVIKAWTETSDWNLSAKTAPPNIYYDEHYLCTAAAGGHRKIVRPVRSGVRHGHRVTVNRQLCIANAFEQVLEEKTPRFHRAVRGFYDRYGFPIAKMIRSPFAADVVYIMMKPLEYLFLIVLYLTDINPENRIALQYTDKTLKDFSVSR